MEDSGGMALGETRAGTGTERALSLGLSLGVGQFCSVVKKTGSNMSPSPPETFLEPLVLTNPLGF